MEKRPNVQTHAECIVCGGVESEHTKHHFLIKKTVPCVYVVILLVNVYQPYNTTFL